MNLRRELSNKRLEYMYNFYATYSGFSERAVFYRVPMFQYNEFKSIFGSKFKLRYRGPRSHRIAQGRSQHNCQSTCLKIDATHFTAYPK
jgi:hypothetical protein